MIIFKNAFEQDIYINLLVLHCSDTFLILLVKYFCFSKVLVWEVHIFPTFEHHDEILKKFILSAFTVYLFVLR